MTKEWGVKSGLNPVIYFTKNSQLANMLNQMARYFAEKTNKISDVVFGSLFYTKPYEGKLFKNGKLIENNVRFYDEHEWRHVPNTGFDHNGQHINYILDKCEYTDVSQRSQHNRQLENSDFSLRFDADDIKYIIIPEQKHINKVVRKLRQIKGPRYTMDTIDRLITRIITVEQIETDF